MEILRGLVDGNNALDGEFIAWPDTHPGDGLLNYSAYNQSRNESLCADVELVDAPPTELREHLATLTPGSERAYWLVPFRGISADHVSFPIDLVFLDRNNCVMAMTESFPIVHATTCNWPAGSALALPAQTIAASEILAGDQLILCSPEKLQRRLRILQSYQGHSLNLCVNSCSLGYVPPDAPVESPAARQVTSTQVIRWEEAASEKPSETPKVIAPAQSAEPATQPSKSALTWTRRNWLLRWLRRHPKELRRSRRETLPWIAVHFFNNSSPVPSAVRNISLDGMFVPTDELWEAGTIVRATLADWRQPSPECSLTVNATVARCDGDGMGFRFIFDNEKRLKRGAMLSIVDWSLANVTRKQIKDFLRQFRSFRQPQD